MKQIRRFSLLRWLSIALIVGGVLLLVFQLVVFSRLRSAFAPGSKIAGVDVSGLDINAAADRLTQVYSVPVELHYGQSSFQVKPSALGFTMDLSSMMAAADQARASLPFWSAFWDYLFNRFPASQDIPIRAQVNVDKMRTYLINEVASRYDQEAEPYTPIPGDIYFTTGRSGLKLDVDRSIELISMALNSPSNRVVNLSVKKSTSARPSLENLKILLGQIIDANGFTGTAEIYLIDLQSGQDIQFAYSGGEHITPDIAFSAYSTIKIPIMIEVFRRKSEPLDEETNALLKEMMTHSNNDATDTLMRTIMDYNLGPLEVSATLNTLGIKNTFLSGLFYTGAPLLRRFSTPANIRTDIDLDPDIYNQTTPTDMGQLLNDIYQCAQNGGGSLRAIYPGQISQNECRAMIALLSSDRIAMLIESGLPDGTQIAHKHGWGPNDILHFMNDAAIVYTPGGNFILVIFTHQENAMIFNNVNDLFASLSRAIYNYFNLGSQ